MMQQDGRGWCNVLAAWSAETLCPRYAAVFYGLDFMSLLTFMNSSTSSLAVKYFKFYRETNCSEMVSSFRRARAQSSQ